MNIDETIKQLLEIKEDLIKLGGVDITSTRVYVDGGATVKYYHRDPSGKTIPKRIWVGM
jgi:hypothetical protein